MLYTILVNWNGWEDTIVCVRSLLETKNGDLTVIVCDNDSHDHSVEKITEWADSNIGLSRTVYTRILPSRAVVANEWTTSQRSNFSLVLVSNIDNLGFAGGNNVGIEIALADPTCRHIFILNNDTEVMPDTLHQLQIKASSASDLAVIGCTLVFHDKPDIVQGLGAAYDRRKAQARTLFAGESVAVLPYEEDIEALIEYAIGAAMFISADVLRRTNGLSECYFLYYEELDLSQKLLPGERIGWASKAIVKHKVGGSIGTGRVKQRPSDTSIYYDHRSKIRFYMKYWPHYLPFLCTGIFKTLLAYSFKRDFRAVFVIFWSISDYLTKNSDYRRDLGR